MRFCVRYALIYIILAGLLFAGSLPLYLLLIEKLSISIVFQLLINLSTAGLCFNILKKAFPKYRLSKLVYDSNGDYYL